MLDFYSFDITNNIKNNINKETYDIMFEISGSTQGYSTFYSSNYWGYEKNNSLTYSKVYYFAIQ